MSLFRQGAAPAPRSQVDRRLQTVDVLPTMADPLGIEMPWRVDGQSGLDAGTTRSAFSVYTPLKSNASRTHHGAWRRDWPRRWRERPTCSEPATDRPVLYGIGPYRDLLGRSLTEFAVRRSAAVRGSIDNSELFEAVDPRSGYLPVHLTGDCMAGKPTGRSTWPWQSTGVSRPRREAGPARDRRALTPCCPSRPCNEAPTRSNSSRSRKDGAASSC